MTREKIIEKIEKMIEDKNFYINNKKGRPEQFYAWEYARAELLIVLKMLKNSEF